MQLETEYIEYGIELSLALIGASMAYFFDPSTPITFLSLLFVPALYGYTAYISHEGFARASLMSLPALILVVTGGITALLAVFYSIGNILVSVFSHGTQFKDFYGSTSLPLLFLGLITGSAIFGYGAITPGFQQNLAEDVGKSVGEFSGSVLNQTEMMENSEEAQLTLINNTARSAVRLTRMKILNDVEPTPELMKSFSTAEENVTEEIYIRAKSRLDRKKPGVSERLNSAMTSYMKNINFAVIIPLVAGAFYTLQPLVGILTAIFGKISLLLDS